MDVVYKKKDKIAFKAIAIGEETCFCLTAMRM